jgi:4-amino-4-deoxy-L-arabinose transferase-like glycosyltransferase
MNNFSPVKKRENIIILLILGSAVFLRIFRLGRQSLWIDEINAVILSGKNIFKIIFAGDTTPPFIYLVNHFWQKLGASDFMVRVPSVVFGVLSIWAVYKLAKALFTKKEALFSLFLASVSLYHIIYSQEAARPYSAFLLFSLLSLYCLCQMLKTTRRKYWAGFVIFNTLNLYTHNFSIFVLTEEIIICALFIFWGFLEKRNNHRWGINRIFNFFLILTAILILSLPISMQFFSAAKYEIAGGKVTLSPIYFKNLLCRYGAGNGLPLLVYNFFFIIGSLSLFKGDKRKEIGLLIFWLVFPFFILSFLELKHFFHIRYVIFTYPAYIIIVSKGITNFLDSKYNLHLKNVLTAMILIVFAGLSYGPLRLYYQMPARLTDWRGAADYIYNTAEDGARVITQEWQDNLIRYYLARKPAAKDIEIMPHHNNAYYLAELLSNNYKQELYCVAYGEDVGYGTDEFSILAERYFRKKKVFYSPVYSELVKRELIDGDGNSWIDVGVRGYRLVVYFNP